MKMMRFTAAALCGVASAGSAQSGEINAHARLAAAVRQGCSVQQVHTPAGKTVHATPIVRCIRVTPSTVALNHDLAEARSRGVRKARVEKD